MKPFSRRFDGVRKAHGRPVTGRRGMVAGFTLIELVVTLMVAGVVFAIAIPSLRDLVQRNRLTTSTNLLVSSLHRARAEAVQRNDAVSLCARTRAGKDLSEGWFVALGDQCDVSKVVSGVEGVKAPIVATGVRQIIFRGDGSASGTIADQPAFELVNAGFRREVYVETTGQVRTETPDPATTRSADAPR